MSDRAIIRSMIHRDARFSDRADTARIKARYDVKQTPRFTHDEGAMWITLSLLGVTFGFSVMFLLAGIAAS